MHYFLSDMSSYSAPVHLASLQEATTAMRFTYRDNKQVVAHLTRVDRVMGRFLELARMSENELMDDEQLHLLRQRWRDLVPGMAESADKPEESNRRLGALLRQAGRSWQEVYNI